MAERTINTCAEGIQQIDTYLDTWQGVCKDVLFKQKNEMVRAGRKVEAKKGRRI